MAHGSAAAVVVGVTTAGADGRAVTWTGGPTVGSGVLEAVESLDPHPVSVSAVAAVMITHLTIAHRTAWRGNAPRTTRLDGT
jgi:hypothetical protein